MMVKVRKHLSAAGLLSSARRAFSRVKDTRVTSATTISMPDALMSAVAMFGLKCPSLLQYDQGKKDPIIAANLKTLHGIERAPCDTQMREILDPIDPDALRPAFKAVLAHIQAGKALEAYKFLDGNHLVAIDATGYFSSSKVHCENCCVKVSSSGTTTYYHQMLGAVIVHPDQKQVLPLVPEAISKQDGTAKNDCEQNAARRLLPAMRRDHPHLGITIIGDGLFSKSPMVELARSLKMGFIFTAKPGDHQALFATVDDADELGGVARHSIVDGDITHFFRFINDVPLNASNPETHVNFIEYQQLNKAKTLTFSWVTDIVITKDNVLEIMRGARSRWHIENETFNTLKNQGYEFEHNFGHGKVNLSTNFAYLMLLAFLIDQAQELCCPLMRALFTKKKNRKYVWEQIRSFFLMIAAESWETLYRALLSRFEAALTRNTT